MKIQVLQTFAYFPPTGGAMVELHEGQVVEVSDADGRLWVQKGHAKEVAAPSPSPFQSASPSSIADHA